MTGAPQPRLRRGELATAAWGLALLVAMFAVKWYGVDNIPGRSPSVVSAVDAWNGLSVLRWLMLVTILLTLASVALHLSQGDHGSQTDTSLVLAVAATLVAAGLVYRVLIALPEAQAIVDQKLGALLGLGCGLAMAVSAWEVRRLARAAARAPVVAHRRPRNGAPAPAALASAPGGSASAPAGSASAPAGSASAPGGSAPAPAGSAPAPGGSAPAPGGSAPAPAGSASAKGGSASAPAGDVGATEATGPVVASEPGASGDPIASESGASGDPIASEPGASGDPIASEPGASGDPTGAPAGAETPAGDPAPRRRRARTSRPRPT